MGINGMPNVVDWIPQETDENAGLGKMGTCCTELDMWEANSISTAYTMHSCNVTQQTECSGTACGDNAGAVTPEAHRFEGYCDKNGCDFATTVKLDGCLNLKLKKKTVRPRWRANCLRVNLPRRS